MTADVLRPCLDCGKPAHGNRCELHRRSQRDAMNRPTAAARGYDSAWRKVVREVVTNHVLTHGWTCPGYGRAPHPATDLSGDHVISLADGGQSTAANVRILCRQCNSRKGRRSGGTPDHLPGPTMAITAGPSVGPRWRADLDVVGALEDRRRRRPFVGVA